MEPLYETSASFGEVIAECKPIISSVTVPEAKKRRQPTKHYVSLCPGQCIRELFGRASFLKTCSSIGPRRLNKLVSLRQSHFLGEPREHELLLLCRRALCCGEQAC